MKHKNCAVFKPGFNLRNANEGMMSMLCLSIGIHDSFAR